MERIIKVNGLQINVQSLGNGETVAKYGNFEIIQQTTKLGRFNTCSINEGNYIKIVPGNGEIFSSMFIAIHLFKHS